MLKDNEKNFSRLHMLIDAVVLALSYFLAWLIRFVSYVDNCGKDKEFSAVYADAYLYHTGLSAFVSGIYLVYAYADAGTQAGSGKYCEGQFPGTFDSYVYILYD